MDHSTHTQANLQFLSGGGEMGRLTREKDWSNTAVGSPEHWPQSLRTTLSIILNSKFPMFLFWGPELLCFYNDAYRPSLGNEGKHPNILGGKAEEFWKEIWKDIKPIIDHVLAGGEANWSEDQLLPIYRNGKMEDVYWTFSYSPVNDESGKPAGVFVTCTETTDKIITFKKLEESNRTYLKNIIQAPVAMCILRGKDYVVEIANDMMLGIWGKTADQVLNKPIFEGVPEVQGQGLEPLLDDVYQTGVKFIANERPVDLPRGNKIETTYINFVYEALRDADGMISGVVAIASEVTLQVQARQKIEESREKLNVVIEASNLGTWELDLETREPRYSKRYLQIMGGYTEDIKLSHAQLLQHVYPNDIPIRNKAFKDAFETGYLHFESRVVWNDQSIHWIEARGKLFYNRENKPIKLMGTIGDITEEKRREQKLLELSDSLENKVLERTKELKQSNESLIKSEERYHLMVEEVQDYAILYLNREGIIENWNKGAEKIKGYHSSEIIGKSFSTFYATEDREKNLPQRLLATATQMGQAVQEGWRVRKDGSLFWARVVITAVHNAANQVIGFSKVTHDLTEKKNAIDELKRSEERYHLMVEEVQDYAILYLNREGIIENWNKGAERIKGYSAAEIIGKSFSSFYTDEDRQRNLPQHLLALATQTGRAVQEGWRVRKDGSLFWASVVITAVHNEANEVIGFSKVTHDLTEKKKSADRLKQNSQELRQKNIDLEKMNKELESFAYISSHDLQEPLRKIQTFSTQILEKEIQTLSESGKDKFIRMQNAAKRMQKLIEDLLTYSRTNTAERKFEKTDLNAIIEEVKEDFKEELSLKHATIENGGMCDVPIIPFQFRQLLFNLISNSLKFVDEKRPPHIKIFSESGPGASFEIEDLSKKKKYCHIRFSDNGIGFDQKYNRKIFEVFQRLHGKSHFGGTGIGLAIVKKIVDNHNGVITAQGIVNQGAIFDIYIPEI